MNTDNEYRKFRFIEATDSIKFLSVTEGWLELAESASPRSPKALLQGDYVARLPDGTSFVEVSYKREHPAVDNALADWAAAASRRYGWIAGDHFTINDGTSIPIASIQWERVP